MHLPTRPLPSQPPTLAHSRCGNSLELPKGTQQNGNKNIRPFPFSFAHYICNSCGHELDWVGFLLALLTL